MSCDLVGRDMLDTWEMERVMELTLSTGTSSLRPGLVKEAGLENTIGAASLTSCGSLLCQNTGTRILL